MRIQPFSEGSYGTNTYIVYEGQECILIDAPFPYEKPLSFLKENGLEPQAVLLTHGHFDHIFGLPAIRKAYPSVRIYLDAADMPFIVDNASRSRRMLSEMDPWSASAVSQCGEMPEDITAYGEECHGFRVLRTPGHTAGSVCLYSEKEGILFSGDTLFMSGTGRTDLGGSPADMRTSLKTLMSLPDRTMVLPGHGPLTTIEKERKGNPFL